MSKVMITEQYLTDIADAIREKLETQDEYKPSEMAEAILSISGGGGGYTYIETEDGKIGLEILDADDKAAIWYFNGVVINSANGIEISDSRMTPYIPSGSPSGSGNGAISKAYDDASMSNYIGDLYFYNNYLRALTLNHAQWTMGTFYGRMITTLRAGAENYVEQLSYKAHGE